MGKGLIARVSEALVVTELRRRTDDLWWPDPYYWHPSGKRKSDSDVLDWGWCGLSEMMTLKAFRDLKAPGRQA